MALTRKLRVGDRVSYEGHSAVVTRHGDGGIVWMRYEDGKGGLKDCEPGVTCIIAWFHDGTFNRILEHLPKEG